MFDNFFDKVDSDIDVYDISLTDDDMPIIHRNEWISDDDNPAFVLPDSPYTLRDSMEKVYYSSEDF